MNRRKFIATLAGLGSALAISLSIMYVWLDTQKNNIVNALLPPGQRQVDALRVLHEGPVPKFDETTWTFQVYGLVKNPFELTYEEFKGLSRVVVNSDFHCVTGWSKLENKWEGVLFSSILERAELLENAKFATIECFFNYTTSLPIEDLLLDDVLLAFRLDDKDLPFVHGGPLRLVVPHKYGYKSAKWVRKIKFTEEQELGYWEKRGYSNTADPFTDDRY